MNTRIFSLVLSAVVCGAASGCGDDAEQSQSPQVQAGAPASADAGVKLDFSRFDKALTDAIEAYNTEHSATPLAGASAVIVHEKLGTVHSHGYGEFAEDRLFLIASSSKILSAGVLMRLADQGKLDVDAPIGQYLGDWGKTKASQITAAQLVSNSSGLPSLSEVSGAANDPKSPFTSNLCQYTDAGSLRDCGKVLYSTEPPRAPASMFAYGGSQWQLAGAVAEVVSGKPWAELSDETYVKPCEVASLGFTNQFGSSGGLGYPAFFKADRANLPETKNPSIEGGAFVNAQDYGKLLLMHLRGGRCGDKRVLSEAATARMQKNRIKEYGGTTGSPAQPGYGLGFWTNESGKVITDGGAYGSFPLLDLERRYGIFIVIESTSEVGGQLGNKVKPVVDSIFDDAKLSK